MSKANHTTEQDFLNQKRLEVLTDDTAQAGVKSVHTDGKVYRLVRFGEDFLAGQLAQAPAVIADFEGLAVGADAEANQNQLTVTLGATGVSANELEGATVVVESGPGAGLYFHIDKHGAAIATADLVVTLNEALPEALTTSSVVSIIPNPYVDVIVAPATVTGKPLGVAQNDAEAGDWGWIQTQGFAAAIANGAVTKEDAIYVGAVDGTVSETPNEKIIGYGVSTSIADTEVGIVDLHLE